MGMKIFKLKSLYFMLIEFMIVFIKYRFNQLNFSGNIFFYVGMWVVFNFGGGLFQG